MGKSQRKGAKFEQACADYLTRNTDCEVIRKRLHGSADEGDLYGLRLGQGKVTVECKDCRKMELAGWVDEAEAERINDGADYAIVIHHRKGKGEKNFGGNYVTMTLDTFVRMQEKSFQKS